MPWEVIAVVLAALGILMTWMNRKFDKIDEHIAAANKDSNTKWMAVNARVDQTQAIIMRMLEKQGK